MAIHRIYIDGTWYLLPIPEKADTLEATGATNDNKFMTPKKTKELIDSLDLGAINEVVTTGTGNAVTNITVSSDGKTLTATKGSTFSLTNHTHSLSGSAITGVLPISKGGTGATSASTARDALGLGSLALKNSLTSDDIPDLDASRITTGTLSTARIPNLSASKITSGEFNRARIREMLFKDTRDVNENPSELNAALRADFKRTTIISMTDEGTYSGVLTIRPYGSTTDFSGGPVHQIALTQNGGLLHRVSTGSSSWGDWKKIVYSGHSHTISDIVGLGALASKNELVPEDIPNLSASKITSGTFNTARIPNLDAGKITTGTLNVARIPDLNVSKIIGLGNIATKNLSSDFNWAGEHVFQKQITLTGDLAGAEPKYPSVKANILTPEGSYTSEWLMPTASGTLATTSDLTWNKITGKPSLVDTTSNQSIDGIKTFAKKITINYQTAEQIELMASSGKVVLRTSSGQLMMMNNGDSSWGAVLNNNNLGYYTKTVFGKSLVGTGNIEIEVDDVPTLPYTKISGLGSLALKNSLTSSDIPNLDAGKITTGTFSTARIPNLDAGKITSGTFSTAVIPDLNVSKIIGLGNIATNNLSSDFYWTGKHTFDMSPGNTKAIEFKTTSGALPKFTATIDTPEGSYDRWWEMPSLSGTLATLDNIPGVVYGYCSTSASATAKVVSSNTFTSHKTGQIYVIEFVNGNTASAPNININSTGAINVRHLTTNGATTTSPGTDIMYARSRTIWTFVYNGSFLIPIGKSTRYWNALETKMLSYSKGSSGSAITTSDTVSSAIGKLEYRLDNSSSGMEIIATGASSTATGSGQMLNAQASGQMNSNKPYLIIVSGYDHEGVLRQTTIAHAQYEIYGGFFMDAGIVVEIGAFNMGNFEVHAQGMSTSTYRKIEVTLVGYKT